MERWCVECRAELPPAAGRGRARRYCSRSCQARAYRRRRDRGRVTPAPRPLGAPTQSGGSASREDLVRVAVRLADARGLDAVSVRAVAHRAGVTPEAVYRWVRNRDDLLSAMAEHVLGTPRHRDNGHGTPRERLERLGRAEWALYRRHPWLLTVLASTRPPTGPRVLAMVDRAVNALVDAGHDPPDAFAGYLALSGYVQGMALLPLAEQAECDAGGTAWSTWSSTTFGRLERAGRTGGRPWLAAARPVGRTDPDQDLDRWFEFGLHRLLDGLVPPSPTGDPSS
ncbi:TetR/AcrR family transcriptional regulator [Micromonospora sp. C28SCA-DRY-2]|uniref:TetR/AcrR family transcriptional regulator n=1 Tax=Micromonospora sp. C28SCA-DRY-2 TaxID=3059522 RepID=UPI002674807E|nr:TetR/AcrR family transcriptional regulator [Micromonospora sp. C28SCA-DRY-2]MDO3700210.1 TetR/AcrR family transcriptional regulator [Micromonospora sp. C28SCA-DRY-2]